MPHVFNEVLGREVAVPEQPLRVVSFSPAATETLFMLGLGGRVVGVTPFCARPQEARLVRRVGSYNTVRFELLDEISPDLIFTVTGYQRDFALRLAERYPTYPLELPESVAGIADFVQKVGVVSGVPELASELESRLLSAAAAVGPVGPAKVYVEIDLGGPVTFGAYSYITDAVRLLGCRSVFGTAHSEWLTPDLQSVAAEDPDVVFYEPKMFSDFGPVELEKLISSRGWKSLRAVAAGNCFVTPRPLDFLAHHGPSFITESLPWLREKVRMAVGGAT